MNHVPPQLGAGWLSMAWACLMRIGEPGLGSVVFIVIDGTAFSSFCPQSPSVPAFLSFAPFFFPPSFFPIWEFYAAKILHALTDWDDLHLDRPHATQSPMLAAGPRRGEADVDSRLVIRKVVLPFPVSYPSWPPQLGLLVENPLVWRQGNGNVTSHPQNSV